MLENATREDDFCDPNQSNHHAQQQSLPDVDSESMIQNRSIQSSIPNDGNVNLSTNAAEKSSQADPKIESRPSVNAFHTSDQKSNLVAYGEPNQILTLPSDQISTDKRSNKNLLHEANHNIKSRIDNSSDRNAYRITEAGVDPRQLNLSIRELRSQFSTLSFQGDNVLDSRERGSSKIRLSAHVQRGTLPISASNTLDASSDMITNETLPDSKEDKMNVKAHLNKMSQKLSQSDQSSSTIIFNVFHSIHSFKQTFMNFNGYMSVFLECAKASDKQGEGNAADILKRYLKCLQHWHPMCRNEITKFHDSDDKTLTDLKRKRQVEDKTSISYKELSRQPVEFKYFIYVPNILRLFPELLPSKFSLDQTMQYFLETKNSIYSNPDFDFYMLILLYHHYISIVLDSNSINTRNNSSKRLTDEKDSKPNQNSSMRATIANKEKTTSNNDFISTPIHERESNTRTAEMSLAFYLNTRIKVMKFFSRLSRVKGKVIINSKPLEFWIDAIIQKKIRFIEYSEIEFHFNQVVEDMLLRESISELRSMNTLNNVNILSNLSNNVAKSIPDQILECMKDVAKTKYHSKDYIPWPKTSVEYLSNVYKFLPKSIESADCDIVQSFFDRLLHELERILIEHPTVSTLTLEDTKKIITCYRLLNQFFHIKFLVKKNQSNFKDRVQKQSQAMAALILTMKLLTAYGTRVIILSKIFKFLGNIYHFLPKVEQEKILTIFIRMSTHNWKIILCNSWDKGMPFPFVHYLAFLKGVERVCYPCPGYDENEITKNYRVLLKSIIDSSDCYLKQSSVSHLISSKGPGGGNLSSYDRFIIDFHLNHCRALFTCIHLALHSITPNIYSLLQELIVKSISTLDPECCSPVFMSLAIILSCEDQRKNEQLYNSVIVPSIQRIINGDASSFYTICSSIGIAQLELPPQNLTQKEVRYLVLDIIWTYITEKVLFFNLMSVNDISTHTNKIEEYYENHRKSNLYSYRHIITNCLFRFSRDNPDLFSEFMNSVWNYTSNLVGLWQTYKKAKHSSSRKHLKFVQEPKIMNVFKAISLSLIVLLHSISKEKNNDLIYIQILKILANLSIFQNTQLLENTMMQCLYNIRRSSESSIADHLIPDFIKEKRIPSGIDQSIIFYFDCIAILISKFSDYILRYTIIPYSFQCLTDDWFMEKAHFVIVQLFKQKHTLRTSVVPYYIHVVLQEGSPVLLKAIHSFIPIIAGNVSSKDAHDLEYTLQQHFLDTIVDRCLKEQSKEGRKDIAKLLVNTLIQISQVISVQAIEISFEAIKRIIFKLTPSLQHHALKRLHSTVVECIDYTRKELCTDFYLQICSSFGTKPEPIEM